MGINFNQIQKIKMATLKEQALEVLKDKGLKAVFVSADGQIFTDKSLADLHKSSTGNAYEKIEETTEVEATAEEVKVIPITTPKKGKADAKATVAPIAEEGNEATTEEVK